MKRILFATFGTIFGMVALLSFKTETTPIANAGGLPSLGTSTTPSATSTAAPPNPTSTPASTSTAKAKAKAKAQAKSATPTPTPAVRTASYVGSAVQTQYGVVQVKVTVSGSKITNVAFVQLTAFDPHSQDINSQAGPILLHETMSAQSSQIDGVSGATYTSDGYLQSLQSALDQAGIK